MHPPVWQTGFPVHSPHGPSRLTPRASGSVTRPSCETLTPALYYPVCEELPEFCLRPLGQTLCLEGLSLFTYLDLSGFEVALISGVTVVTRQLEAELPDSGENTYAWWVGCVPLRLGKVSFRGNQIPEAGPNTCNHTRPRAPANLKLISFTNPRLSWVRAPSTNVAEH